MQLASYLTFGGTCEDAMNSAFEKLPEGGHVTMPLAAMFGARGLACSRIDSASIGC